jgi:hypothetical protein
MIEETPQPPIVVIWNFKPLSKLQTFTRLVIVVMIDTRRWRMVVIIVMMVGVAT